MRNPIKLPEALWGLLKTGKEPLATEVLNAGRSAWLHLEGEGKTHPGTVMSLQHAGQDGRAEGKGKGP